QVDAIAWGQYDPASCQEGGWRYGLNFDSDGSAIGWAGLALLDGAAAGATVPPFVATELANVIAAPSCSNPAGELALTYGFCNNGGGGDGSQNVAKPGILLQALDFMGVPASDTRVQDTLNYISNKWITPEGFACNNGLTNKGCAYGMFNTFKG